MPLPLPDLDDRRWGDLVEEARGWIPRYAPGWTDHNAHDPGIMLVELFAWLTEQGIYRLNQVPDRHKRKFLRLVGFTPEPPRPARAIVAFDPAAAGGFHLPAGFELASAPRDEGRVRFLTRASLDVLDVNVEALKVDAGDGTVEERTQDWRDDLPVAPFGADPRPGAALYLGFPSLPAGLVLHLGFRVAGPGNDVEERARLRAEAAEPADSAPSAIPAHHSARTAWEFWDGASWARLEPAAEGAPLSDGQVRDDTRSFTLDGVVAARVPTTVASPESLGEPRLLYLRCRLAAGRPDTPPALLAVSPNAVWAEQAVPVSHTFPIATGVTPSGPKPAEGDLVRPRMTLDAKGVIQSLDFDPGPDGPEATVWSYVAPSSQAATPGRITMELVAVGRGTGFPGQVVRLPRAPIVLRSLRLYSLTGDTWQEWTRREDLDASGRADWHFVVDATTGAIAFGDGERGRTLPAGALLVARYDTTAAAGGNLRAGTRLHRALTPRNDVALAGVPDSVKASFPPVVLLNPSGGGADAEDLLQASGRAVNTLHAHERLVDLCDRAGRTSLDQIPASRVRPLEAPLRGLTLIDLERIALDVPGTRVGRARAWAERHPALSCLRVPGTVMVVILPDAPGPRPFPSPGLRDAVQRALDLRRAVCTRVVVAGPTYREVRVRARVGGEPLAAASRLISAIRAALDAFLNPLTGGPEGRGWPFGRDVYRSEILQVVQAVAGVDYVSSLSLALDGRETACGNLTLCASELVTPGTHDLEVVAS